MSDKLCGSCKHWGKEATECDPKETGDFRTCQGVIHDHKKLANEKTGNWNDDEENAEIAAMKTHKAVVQDGSGFFAALKCREDFGCSLHEPKPASAS